MKPKGKRISEAILTVLGTLPVGAEIRLFWKEGCQHMSYKLPGEPVTVAKLNRAENGTGVVVPAITH